MNAMQIPMKGKFVRQVNIKITEETYQELCFLRSIGADIGQLLRPDVEKNAKNASKQAKKSFDLPSAS